MFGGNGDGNGIVNSLDEDPVWETQSGGKGYLRSDYNFDTESNNKDKDDIWSPNQGAGNQVPNYRETRNYVKTVMQLYAGLKPPSMSAGGRSPSRVRMELPVGGIVGRGNLPAAQPPALPLAVAAQSEIRPGPE